MQAKNKRPKREAFVKEDQAKAEISNELRIFRETFGITQKVMSEIIGVDIREYQRLEENYFNAHTFLKLLKALDLFPFKLSPAIQAMIILKKNT